jgi:hypothetical protein
MPFKSEKQRKWMWANDPKMAAKWEKKEKKMRETKVRKLIRNMVREIMDEGGPGSGPQSDDDNPFDREPSDDELADIEKQFEAKERNYKEEYKKYGSSKKAKKYRAELNAYNRKKGTYGNGDGKDASHKGGKIAGFEKESVNRGRAEKSRLKKEGKLTEDFKNNEWEVYVADENRREKIVKVAKSKRAAVILYNKLIKTDKYHEVGMRVIKEEKLTEKFDIKSPGYSSKEAKSIIDGALKNYAKVLRKAQYRIIADWMRGAKSGAIDYFDLVRGFQQGDAKRAYPYETDFLMKVLSKDKIIDRFRKYFGGKKGKKR